MSDLLWHLSKLFRLRFFYLATKGKVKPLSALYVLIASFLSLTVLGAVAVFFAWPLVFPSLGPTAFLVFYAPARAMSWPRNCVLGHLLAMACGFAFYFLLVWFFPEKALSPHFGLSKALLVSLAVGLTGLIMVLTDILHPPAASTAMLAAAGYFQEPLQVLGFILGLFLIVAEGVVIHRLAGIIYPWWRGEKSAEQPFIKTKIGEVGEEPPSDDPYARLAHRITTRRD